MDDKNSKDSKARIMEAATVLFANKGLSGVSIRELAEAAQVNSALIFYHFGGKEQLYGVVLEAQYEEVQSGLSSIPANQLSATEKMRYYAQMVAKIHHKNPYLVQFMHAEILHPTVFFETIVQKKILEIYQVLVEIIKEGIAKGEFRSNIDPQNAAVSLAGIINFYFISQPILGKVLAITTDYPEQYAKEAIEIYLKGVSAQ